MLNLKYDSNKYIYETVTDSKTENSLVFAKGEEECKRERLD